MTASIVAARDVMSAPVFAVSPGDTVAHARNLMVRHKISRVLVMDAGKLTGILTKKDIGYHLQQQGAAWRRRPPDQIPVSEYATPVPVVVAPETLLRTIAGIFLTKNIGGLPVVDHGAVTGIVTKTDLMKSALVNRHYRHGTGRDGGCSDGQPLAFSCPRDHAHEGAGQETGGDQ